MDILIPWLGTFVFGLTVFLVGRHLQRNERMQQTATKRASISTSELGTMHQDFPLGPRESSLARMGSEGAVRNMVEQQKFRPS